MECIISTRSTSANLLHLRYPHLPILMLGERGHPGIVRAKKNDEKVEDYAAFPNLNPVQMAVYCLVLLFFCGHFVLQKAVLIS